MQDIKHKMNQLGICVTDMQTQQLNDYYKLLVEKNKVMNLTAITEYDEVVIKHFVDSAARKAAFCVGVVSPRMISSMVSLASS